MAQFSSHRKDRLIRRYGAAVPGLSDELRVKLAAQLSPTTESAVDTVVSRATVTSALAEVIVPTLEVEAADPAFADDDLVAERIVAVGIGARPVARIRNNEATTEFLGPASDTWSGVIKAGKQLIDAAIPAVGRIELNNSDYPWVGTAWLVADDVLVTNRHVVEAFARLDGTSSRFVFRPGLLGGSVSADIDFLEEENRLDSAEHPITSILWIAPAQEADVAFLRVQAAPGGRQLPRPISLAEQVESETVIAAIGYPARDPSIRDQSLVVSVFGDDVYEKKRLSPGMVLSVHGTTLKHDCSTLGGNSGSVLIDLRSGQAVGLHRGGLVSEPANVAVTAAHVGKLLRLALSLPAPEAATRAPAVAAGPPSSVAAGDTYRCVVNIPLELTVKVSVAPTAVHAAVACSTAGIESAEATSFDEALKAAVTLFRTHHGVLKVQAGFRFKNGWITDERVIVVEVADKLDPGELQARGLAPLPRDVHGVGVDVRTAALPAQLEALSVDVVALERRANPGGYKEPLGYNNPQSEMFLGRVVATMDAVFHVSPDAGFKNLRAFLGRVRNELTATMYEWDEANHISASIAAAIAPEGRTLRMVTQKRGVRNSEATEHAVADMQHRLGTKFKHVWASVVGPQRLIPGSYHIKVASRDGEELWLSSGNWKDSNQPANPVMPDALRSSNREWHALIRNQRLATLFQKYIEYDFEQAKLFPLEESKARDAEARAALELEFFVPEAALMPAPWRPVAPTYPPELVIHGELLDIQPLLTPDRDSTGNPLFLRMATELVEQASDRVYVQNQSFNLTEDNNTEFERFFTVLKAKQQTIRDVRVLMRDARDYGSVGDLVDQQELINRLKTFGLDTSPERLRIQSKCHTKGIIVDGQKVLLGSQNLTNGGSLFNRDAALLVSTAQVAAFYEKVFLFDWDHLAHNEAAERIGGIRRAMPGETTPPGFRRMRLSDLLPGS